MERTTSSIPRVWLPWKLLPGGLLRLLKQFWREANHIGPGVHHFEGRTSAMDCIDPNSRAAVAKKTREELDLLTEKEHLPPREGAAKNGGLAARQRRNDCEPCHDRWPSQVPERWLRCCVGFHLSVTFMSWDRVRRSGGRCAHGYVTRDARRTSVPLSRVSIGALGQERRLQLIRCLHQDKIW